MIKHSISFFAIFIFIHLGISKAQNFSIIDTLPTGAYGTATWGDFDNDGFKDLAYLSQVLPDAACQIYHNTNNVFTEVSQQFPLLFNPAAKWADLDNDGFDDLVVCGLDSVFVEKTFVYRSLGNGTFVSMNHAIPGLSVGSIDIEDYNHDGLPDIAISGYGVSPGLGAYIFKNTGSFTFVDINAPIVPMHGGELTWKDYNYDSLPDLVVNGEESVSAHIRFYKNLGSDVFQEESFNFPGTIGTVDWIDFDLDGFDDLFITGIDSSFVQNASTLYRNDGSGNFTLVSPNIPAFGEPSAVTIADFNNDSIQDICLVGGNSQFNSFSVIAYGQGTSTFNFAPLPRAVIDNLFVEATDMDSDGDMDLVMSTYILRNDGAITGLKSVSENSNDGILYPNPATSELNILSAKKVSSFYIYDLQSQLVFENKSESSHYNIPTKNLTPGIYSIRVVFSDGEVLNKLFQVSH